MGKVHHWKQSREIPALHTAASLARKSLEECFLLSCRLPSGIWEICQAERCQFVISTLPVVPPSVQVSRIVLLDVGE